MIEADPNLAFGFLVVNAEIQPHPRLTDETPLKSMIDH